MLVLIAAVLSGSLLVDEVPETVFSVDPKVFSCTPSSIREGMKLTIRKDNPELDELAVLTPYGETMHFLIVWRPPEEMSPLMTDVEYSEADELVIDVSTLEGLEWKRDARPERIFTRPGKYEFFVSPVLESEIGGYRCAVEFRK